MSELTDIEALAGEYVLGTLDAVERAAVASRRSREPVLDAAIMAWERRLAPLAAAAVPVTPPAQVLTAITARIGNTKPAANVVQLKTSRDRWRALALAATSLAACLAVATGVVAWLRVPEAGPQNYVAVFQKDNASPAFVLAVDLASRTLSVRRVGAELPAGKSYQLWIAADPLGPGMHSLGLVGNGGSDVRQAIAKFDPAVVEKATFGVSLEPEGGSPTGQPTGPAFVAKLIPATP